MIEPENVKVLLRREKMRDRGQGSHEFRLHNGREPPRMRTTMGKKQRCSVIEKNCLKVQRPYQAVLGLVMRLEEHKIPPTS